MIVSKNFSYYLSHFFKEYLVVERNCSEHTIRSYKNSFKQFVDYLVTVKNFKLQNINFDTITREMVIEFLNYLEETCKVTIRTRNLRLTAIKSFYQYCSIEEIENFDNINKILSIKTKKEIKKVIEYLTEEELKTLFDSIDATTRIGFRDYVLLSLLYDTAARASEIINIKLEDIRLDMGYIILSGKGSKQRIVPIMENTKELLVKYMETFRINGYLFNNKGNKYSKNLIPKICIKYANIIQNKTITPHTFRHTRAVHLLDHSVPLIYIQELLGHSSVQTTQIYATVIERAKFKAIEKVTPNYKNDIIDDWNDDSELLNQLLNM